MSALFAQFYAKKAMRKDPFTGELFEPKRNNQVYANRKNQIDHNNEKARKQRNSTSVLDKRLKENRSIIAEILNKNDSVEITKDYLKGKGFDLSLFNRMLLKDGVNVYGVYEFYLKPLNERKVELGKI